MSRVSPAGAAAADRRLALGLAALAIWAIAVPWLARAVGLELDVPARLEIIDHVIPGAVALACAAVVGRAQGPGGELRRLISGSAAALAGLWITSTHATLVPEAVDGISPWGPALLHLSTGPPIVAAGMWIVLAAPSRT